MSHLLTRRPYLLLIIACLCSVMVRAESLAPFAPGEEGLLFKVAGSNTVGAKLMKNLLQDYFTAKGLEQVQVSNLNVENEYRVSGMRDGQQFFVDVAAHGSTTGFEGLNAGDVNLAMSSRAIKPEEVSALKRFGEMESAAAEHVIAIDGLAVIVHPSNPLESLDIDTIAKIFAGEIRNWRELGGEDLPIRILARDDRSGTWETFESLVLGKTRQLHHSAQRLESNDQLSDLVAADRGAIGFVGLASVRDARALLVGDKGTTPLLPEAKTVATEDYVLSRRLFLYTPANSEQPTVSEFVHYVQSRAGQQQVEKTGFVSQAVIETGSEQLSVGPLGYRRIAAKASRLSVNFRFAEGSSRLDNKALRDIGRLAEYMHRPENKDKKLLLIGFGDSQQTESRAIVLSKLRASAVKRELYRVGIGSLPVRGYGAFMPVAADTTQGKIKNRRVEVWVK